MTRSCSFVEQAHIPQPVTIPWPFCIVREFEKVPVNPKESDFHGAYNKLLNTLFPVDSAFTVHPQFMSGTNNAADFLIIFEVMFEDRPVLIVELKLPEDLRYASRRASVDQQIRDRIGDLYEYCPIPNLHAVSAVGTRLCFFIQRPGEPIELRAIPADAVYQTDTAPQERWGYDILEQEGEQKFRAVVQEIKEACAILE